MMVFGYPRANGFFGVRNHLLILSTVVCANQVTKEISQKIPGSVAITHPHGCCMLGSDFDQLQRTLLGFATHPNVGAVLVVGLGCEQMEATSLADKISKTGRPVGMINIQECKGSANAINRGVQLVKWMSDQIQTYGREPFPISELIIATECGASDFSSGIATNPIIGWLCDRLVDFGGSVILSETIEVVGGEQFLIRRAINQDVACLLEKTVLQAEENAIKMGVDIRGSQPTPGNIRGGLTTIEEKSLGCICKAGSSQVQGVVSYAEPIKGKGLWFMDTPGQDVESITGMVAGGAQIVIFSTGLGSPVGCPIAPVLKITGNSETAINMREHIDLNVAPTLLLKASIESMGNKLLNLLIDVANGTLTKAERLGYREFAINRIGPTL